MVTLQVTGHNRAIFQGEFQGEWVHLAGMLLRPDDGRFYAVAKLIFKCSVLHLDATLNLELTLLELKHFSDCTGASKVITMPTWLGSCSWHRVAFLRPS